MAKISALPAAGELQGDELLPLVQDEETRRVTHAEMVAGLVGSDSGEGVARVTTIMTLIQGQYDLLSPPDENTLYIIVEEAPA
jgi:hypothetical protein